MHTSTWYNNNQYFTMQEKLAAYKQKRPTAEQQRADEERGKAGLAGAAAALGGNRLRYSGNSLAGSFMNSPDLTYGQYADGSLGVIGDAEDAWQAASPELYKQMKSVPNRHVFDSMPAREGIGAAFIRGKAPDGSPISGVFAPKGSNPATLAHEMGHGTGLVDNKLYRSAVDMASNIADSTAKARRYIGLGAPLAPLVAGKTDRDKETMARYGRNTAIASGLLDVPELFEEARATKRAIQYAPKGSKLSYAKALAAPYATYLTANATIPTVSALASEYQRRKYKELADKQDAALAKTAAVEYHGKTFPGYNQPIASDRAEKKKMVLAKEGDKVKLIHFGQKGYKHNYSNEAKQNYLKRSAGIVGKNGLTKNDKMSANYWARRELWPRNEPADGTAKDN